MIRYFIRPVYGPWYEIEEQQWLDLDGPRHLPGPYSAVNSPLYLTLVYVDTAKALKADVKADFPGLQDMIWYPDMRCGDCNGRLIDLNEADPEKRYPNYAHATTMMDRHGAWPVERWDD
jgi:hypothetical protein